MQREIITDNTIDNYIVISPTKPSFVFFPKEESQVIKGVDYLTGADTDGKITTNDAESASFIDHRGSPAATVPINSSASPSDYIGAAKIDVPHIIDLTFTDLLLFDSINNPISIQQSSDLNDSLVVDLNGGIATLMNGLQVLTVPADIFNTTLTVLDDIIANKNNPVKNNYGKYYIKISPKYIETEITNIFARKHKDWNAINSADNRRTLYYINKTAFSGTPWDFSTIATVSGQDQGGRLLGSVTEVLNSTKTVIKQTKFITENNLYLNSSYDSEIVLSPDNIGYDSILNQPAIGDILRIYPRETYFNPIFIELDYQDNSMDIRKLLQFISNDATRDLKTNVIEIYDENGITTDSQGNLNGNVSQSYIISIENDKEIKRKLK